MTMVTAFVAGLIASLAMRFHIGNEAEIALAASVLLLVPGVPLINSVVDLVRGYTSVGIARGITGALITFAIALGLLLAMHIVGVSGL